MLSAKRALLLPALVLAVAAVAGVAHAQSPLGVGSAEPAFSIGGPFGPFFAWINTHQQAFYRSLTGALKAMRQDPSALTGLIGLSFAYGVFHAAGPGHGKAVISSYMIANEVELKRGVVISLLSALLQGVVAVALVGVAYVALRGSGITMTQATQAMEIASFAMVALFGAWLLWRKLRTLRLPSIAISAPLTVTSGAGRGPTGLSFQAVEVTDHDPSGDNGYCEACGVSHMPDPAMLRANEFNLREAWSAIVAVGLRPCSGAILVMSFALLNGLYLGGVLSVLAMSLGTAITVTLLATLAVTAKDVAIRIAGERSHTGRVVGHAIEIGGALFVLLVGLSLLGAALQA